MFGLVAPGTKSLRRGELDHRQHLAIFANVVAKRDEAGHRGSELQQSLRRAAIFLALGRREISHPEPEQANYAVRFLLLGHLVNSWQT
jgi:hypothetical protein